MLVRLRRIALLMVALIAIVLGVWFCIDNTEKTPLVLFGRVLSPHPLGLLMTAAYSLGVVTGLLASAVTTSWLLFRLRRLDNKK